MKTALTLFSGAGVADYGLRSAGFELVGAIERDPKAAEIYRRNFGDHVINDDVFKIDYHQFEGVDLIHASPPCFVAGTLVLVERGLIPIEEVVIGDRVLTHMGRYRSVTNVWTKASETIVLKGFGHFGIETTSDHLFYSVRQSFKYPGKDATGKRPPKQTIFHDPEWVKAEDMLGKYWLTPSSHPESTIPAINYPYSHNKRLPDFNEPFMWVIGYWLGNGWIRLRESSGEVLISVGKNTGKDRILASKLNEADIKYNITEQRTSFRYVINSKPLAYWLREHFNLGAENKSVPSWMMGIPQNLRRAFLDGYLEADGHKVSGTANSYGMTTVSKKLAIGIKLLANSLKLSFSLHYYTPKKTTALIEGREVNIKPTYTGEMMEDSRYYQFVGDYGLGKVKKIFRTEMVKQVFDLEVEEDHSFIADGLVVHNCQNFSTARSKNLPAHPDKDAGYAVIEAVKAINPRWVTIENVPGYVKSDVYQAIRSELWAMGYWINEKVINCADYGVPQSRRRLFMIAAKGTIPSIPEPAELRVSWWNAIADLVPDCPEVELPPYLKARISDRGFDPDKLSNCLIRRYSRIREAFSPIPADKPSPTILAQGGDGHWRQLDLADDHGVTRKVIPRCAARFMTLGDDFWLPSTNWVAWKAMGNGFPALTMRRMVEGLM